MNDYLTRPNEFNRFVTDQLHQHYRLEDKSGTFTELIHPSSVLLLVGWEKRYKSFEPYIILNKRSERVRQPGDLCCPGGSVAPLLDPWLARLLRLPMSPLARWPFWKDLQTRSPQKADALALLFATGLREGFEEMRLLPIGIDFLGTLPPQKMISFQRTIYPMVAGVRCQKHFFPNSEVAGIIPISIHDFFSKDRYACYRVRFTAEVGKRFQQREKDFPCFIHETANRREVLWGATYRIVTVFLEIVFGFKPPDLKSRHVIHKRLDKHYLTGVG